MLVLRGKCDVCDSSKLESGVFLLNTYHPRPIPYFQPRSFHHIWVNFESLTRHLYLKGINFLKIFSYFLPKYFLLYEQHCGD